MKMESDLGRHESALFHLPESDLESLLEATDGASEELSTALLRQAKLLCTEDTEPDLLLWKAEIEADLGMWGTVEQNLRALAKRDPQNQDAKSLLVESLVRLSRWSEAREMLESFQVLSAQERHTLQWLKQPEQRLEAQTARQRATLHPLYGIENLSRASFDVYGNVPKSLSQGLTEFHQREFPGSVLGFSVVSEVEPKESFEELRDLVDTQGRPTWVNPEKRSLIFTTKGRSTAYSSGIGSDLIAVVKLAPEDPFQQTVCAHELYHCLLGLNHSNGLEGPDDPSSVMGPWGVRAPLATTHICSDHYRFCTSTDEVQELVEEKKWEQALVKDPDYLALYKLLSEELIAAGQAQQARALLAQWFERDPGPEACSALTEAKLRSAQCPRDIFAKTRGFGQTANTHLYLAQACLNAEAFELALECAQSALELEADNLNGLLMSGRALLGLNKDYEAKFYLREVHSRVPDWDAVRELL